MSFDTKRFTQEDWMGYAGAWTLPDGTDPFIRSLKVLKPCNMSDNIDTIYGDLLICGDYPTDDEIKFGEPNPNVDIVLSFNMWNAGDWCAHVQREVKTLEVGLNIAARLPEELTWAEFTRWLDVYGFDDLELM
jgi:hypothetical protein